MYATDELFSYAVAVRRDLHKHPEIGFDLKRTADVVTRELTSIGFTPTSAYGKCSVVAEIGQGEELVLVRADMDALPVNEQNDLPYKSQIPGKMHACGHDSHTAILLAVAKYLKAHEHELTRRIRLMFQPAEESSVSGAKMMMDNGVTDGVTSALCTHCDNTVDVGSLVICPGDYMAACIPLTVLFFGKASHATFPQDGVDAIAMANEAYLQMKAAVREEAGDLPYIWSVGRFSGGDAHNVIADRCEMNISFRYYDTPFSLRAEARVKEICSTVAARYGGSCEIDWHVSTVPVHNDEALSHAFEDAARAASLPIHRVPPRMSSEDFGWILSRVPGFIFRFGTKNDALGCIGPSHKSTFMIDEEGMRTAIDAFLSYLLR